MSFGQKALQVLQRVAPELALAIGGPFGPIAATAISVALNTPAGDAKAAEAALLNATPEQLLALQTAREGFMVQMRKLGIDEQKLAFDDIASARQMQRDTRDPNVGRLAWLLIAGFLVVGLVQITAMLLFAAEMAAVPPAVWLQVGNVTGYLANEAKQAAAFYFGTTSSSQTKDATIADIAKQP
jgi:hypothetical protein